MRGGLPALYCRWLLEIDENHVKVEGGFVGTQVRRNQYEMLVFKTIGTEYD